MPCAGRVRRATYIPGALWPVNRIGVEGIDGLFAENERLCAFLAVAGEGIDLCLAAVGATLVGKVRVTFDDLTTNAGADRPLTRTYADSAPCFARGEEWGRFEFGSTIVMVAAAGAPGPANRTTRGAGVHTGWPPARPPARGVARHVTNRPPPIGRRPRAGLEGRGGMKWIKLPARARARTRSRSRIGMIRLH
jgi:phosphatidylserine decarboxylase